MLTGHEEEFRRLFAEEAERRLDALVASALELERGSADAERVRAMFRDAHTLKGSAGVVGFTGVAAALHALEHDLDDLRAGRRAGDPAMADEVLRAVDAIRALIAEAMGAAPPAAGPPALASPAEAPLAQPPPADPPEAARAIPVPVDRVDALVRLAGEAAGAQLRLGRLLHERFGADPTEVDEYRELGRLLGQLQDTAMRARTVALASVAGPLRRAARDLARERGKDVDWSLEGEATELDRHVLERLREPLVALVRNAIDHGIEPPDDRRAAGKPPAGAVRVSARRDGARVLVSVADDGRGIDAAAVAAAAGRAGIADPGALAAVFEPGVSTAAELTGTSGRGVGLDAVRAAVLDLHGSVDLESTPGAGTRITLAVPLSVAVMPCLVVEAGGGRWAIPLHSARSAHAAGAVPHDDRGEPIAVSGLADVLGLPAERPASGPILVVSAPAGTHGLRLDAIAGEREVVAKDLGGVVPRGPLVGGAAVDPDGSVLVLLDPAGLVETARARVEGAVAPAVRVVRAARPAASASVLVVDDALTIRELQRSILQRAGYDTRVAADGADALRVLRGRRPDVVVTDVEMPVMDGVALTVAIRAMPGLERLPVIVLSGREGERDRRRALDAGADEFLAKSQFDESALLEAVARRVAAAGRA